MAVRRGLLRAQIITLHPAITQSRGLHYRAPQTSSVQVPGVLESPFTATRIPAQTLPEYVWKGIENYPDKPAITCGVTGRSYTFKEARENVRKFAWGLLTTGQLKQGDVVGILLPNVPEYMVAIHGAVEAGLVVTFVNPLYTADEIARQFINAGVKCCITVSQLIPIVSEVTPRLVNYKSTIVVGQQHHDTDNMALSFDQFVQDARPVDLPRLNVDDVAVLPYSSGTTGLPKGVMLSHSNLVSNLEQLRHPNLEKFTKPGSSKPTDVCLTVLPFFHIYGFNGILNVTMIHGLHLLSIPRFVPEDYIATLVKYRPNMLFVVPSLMLFLAAHPAVTREHLASVNKVVCGAAPATKSLVDKFKAKLGHNNINLRQGYGMTELSPVALFPPHYTSSSKVASSGCLVPHTQARIVDVETQESLGPNQPGELWVRGPQMMHGYLNNVEATKETIDEDGWLHTGDVAYYDDDQYFFIVDRTKELIKVKGNQVSPTELENLIMQLPGIADVAVVGIPDTLADEIPRAFIVRQPNAAITAEEICDYVKIKVAPYKKLAGGVRFIEAIPRNPSGKVLRQQLKVLGE